MTDQEINVALAELRGWKKGLPDGFDYGTMFPYSWWKDGVGYSDCPDHLNGIEALGHIHEVEKLLTFEQWQTYIDYLIDLFGDTLDCTPAQGYIVSHATARQRAEAILRTLGKYRETTQ